MRTKNVNFKAVILVIVLFVISGITAYKFLGPGAEDIIKSKKFMEKLYSINAVNTDIDLSDIKYEKVNYTCHYGRLHGHIVQQIR